jgi:RNA polymerase sigma-70 factor (ECF subfamily)
MDESPAFRPQHESSERLLLPDRVLASQPEDHARQSNPEEIGHLRPSSPEVLFRHSYRGIVQSLALATGDSVAAEDATQEAFIEACVRWARISRYDNPEAWVRRVAINKLRKMHRTRVRAAIAVLRLGSEGLVVPPSSEPEPGVLAALSALSPRQRLAVVLCFVDDLTIAEVASAMGISKGAVSQHLSRARVTFRARLENHHDDR